MGEGRDPLGEERITSFAGVGGDIEVGDGVDLGGVPGRTSLDHAYVDAALGRSDGAAGKRGKRPSELDGRVIAASCRNHTADEPPVLGRTRVDAAAEQEQVLGPPDSDETRKALRATARGEHADSDLGEAHDGVFLCYTEIRD